MINIRGFSNGLKTKAEDLIDGKYTAPVACCLVQLKGEPEKQKVATQNDVPAKDRDIAGMVQLIEESGAMDECVDEAKTLVNVVGRKWTGPFRIRSRKLFFGLLDGLSVT